MQSISNQLLECKTTALFFMGQAGFIIKTAKGTTAAVDIYLSNCCEWACGFKRLMPYLLEPGEVEFDYIIATHAHYDHFDVDAMPGLMASEKTRLYAAYDCKQLVSELAIPESRVTYIKCGEAFDLGDIRLEAVKCDHGKSKPEAVGLILSFDGKTVYITGDTAVMPEAFHALAERSIDVLIMPINGAYGNLNEKEAAELCSVLRPSVAIPCHYWNFAEHGGNPQLFVEEVKKLQPEQKYILMRPGEGIEL